MYGSIPRNAWPTVSTKDILSTQAAADSLASEAAYNNATAETSEKSRESGARVNISALIPENVLSDFNQEAKIHKALQFDLVMCFGGCTVEPAALGLWLDDSGEIVQDTMRRYSVSFEPCDKRAARAIAIFEAAGKALNQEWLHIERSTFEAEHVKTG